MSEIELKVLRTLIEAVEAEFCGELTEEMEPDDSKVSYPEERCHITFGMIRKARRVIDSQQPQGVPELSDEQCLRIYDAVSRSNLTRDVKTPARRCGIVRGAALDGLLAAAPSPERQG